MQIYLGFKVQLMMLHLTTEPKYGYINKKILEQFTGLRGPPGQDGESGKDGTPGLDGPRGRDG